MTAPLSPAAFETLATLLKTKSGLIIGMDKLYLLETRLGRHRQARKTERYERPGGASAAPGQRRAGPRRGRGHDHQRKLLLPRRQAVPAFPHPGLAAPGRRASARQPAARLVRGVIVRPGSLLARDDRGRMPPPCWPAARWRSSAPTSPATSLTRAREGLYSQFEVQRGLPVQMLMRYFRKDDSNWRIADTIRGMAQFREYNLLHRPPPARPVRHRVLPQRADLFRPADQSPRAGGDRRADATGWTALPGRGRNRAGHHLTLRPDAERARGIRGIDGDRDNTRCDATAGGGGIAAKAPTSSLVSWPGASPLASGYAASGGWFGGGFCPLPSWPGERAREGGASRPSVHGRWGADGPDTPDSDEKTGSTKPISTARLSGCQ